MIGNDIINKIGGGSGINSGSLVSDLVDINRAPEESRLDRREELLQAQISDFGLLRSALSSLESAVAAVSDRDTFNAKGVSVPDTSLISLTKLEAKAAAGDYRLQIEQTAQSHSLSSGVFASANSALGQGEITLRFGSWNDTLDTFSANPDRTGTIITLDESNNTLAGLRDAINQAGIGVQASIVNDGNGYRLLLSGPSGANNELELSVSEDPEAPGLAAFNFNESTQQLTQQQEGRDALIRLNGLLLSRESNRVTDVIDGLEFDVFNSDPGETINITINADRATAEQAIRDFVEAYNTFLAEAEKLVGFDNELDDFGSLRNDSLAKNLMQTMRSFLGNSMVGLDGDFSNLANAGIRTRRDGTLEINDNPDEPNTNFQAIMNNHFDQVRDFFTPTTQSDNAHVEVNSFSARTQAGSYEVVISQHAEKGQFIADAMPFGFPLDTAGKDYSFEVVVDGTTAASINLPDNKVYNSGVELAAEFQTLINLDPSLQAAGARVDVSFNSVTSALEFTSSSYGTSSIVSFASVGADMADLGINAGAGQAGADVVGTINGDPGFGYGNVLLPALNSPAEGLGLIIGPGVSSATVNFSRGFAGGLSTMIDTFLASNGLISEREKTIRNDIDKLTDDRAALDRRSDAYRSRLQSQFLAMEMIVRSLNNTGSFLDGILDRLPFTASKK